MPQAQIRQGAVAGSARVTVSAGDAADATPVLLYWGNRLLGSGSLLTGQCELILNAPLAEGQIVQAHLTAQGSNCGLPVLVVAGNKPRPGQWVSPTEIAVTEVNAQGARTLRTLTAAQCFAEFGYLPAGQQDPFGLNLTVTPELDALPDAEIQFDVNVERQAGLTTVTVQNVLHTRGAVLVRFVNGAADTGYQSNPSVSYAAVGTVTISVKGSQDANARLVSRSVAISIQAPPPSSPAPDSRIEYYAWRNYPDQVQVYINTSVQVQARIDAGAWQDCNTYDQPRQREALFAGVASGSHQIDIRVREGTDSSKWVTMNIIKYG